MRRQERLLAVQTTMRLLTQDFTQLAPRPVRQPLGDGWLPALLAGTSTGTSMGLSSVSSSTSPAGLGLGTTPTPGAPTSSTNSSTASSTLGTSTSTATGAGTFTSSTTAVAIVTLTRAGWANPAGIQRPALQRVTYILENGTLRREKLAGP